MSVDGIQVNFVLDVHCRYATCRIPTHGEHIASSYHISQCSDGYETLDNDNSWPGTPVKSPVWDFAPMKIYVCTPLRNFTYVAT